MTDWQLVWLGVIAIALSLMALIQIVVLIAIARLAWQAVQGVRDLRREIRPVMEKVHRVADDATRVSSLAVAQAERLSAFVTDTTSRLDDTVGAVQRFVTGPLRQGSAVAAAIKAVIASFRARPRPGRHTHHDDEDPLFVG